jgi:kynurenine formamidase
MPRFVDLSAPIAQSPAALPDLLRTDIAYTDHAQGAKDIEALTGVPPALLRDGEGWTVESFTNFGTHSSTHVDAPWHYNATTADGARAQTIDELPLDWFQRPGVRLDMTRKADGDAVTSSEIAAELDRIGHELQPLDIVLVHTGRDALYDDPGYMAYGPGVTAEATHWLYDRGIRVVGIDAWGWDRPLWMQAEEAKAAGERGIFWAAHQAGIAYAQIERLCNLGALPDTGFTVSCFPLKVVGGSAGPTRAVAILPD